MYLYRPSDLVGVVSGRFRTYNVGLRLIKPGAGQQDEYTISLDLGEKFSRRLLWVLLLGGFFCKAQTASDNQYVRNLHTGYITLSAPAAMNRLV